MKRLTLKGLVPKKIADMVFAYWLPVLTGTLFTALLIISIFNLMYRTKEIRDEIIASDVAKLTKIFRQIDKDCKITGFDYQKNYIDFLNVKGFEGSEVGAMNLMYPANWKGPYLKDNPTVQNKAYQVIKTKYGHFIAPGHAMVLSSGKVVGKDIILDENADIEKMASKGGPLFNDGVPLARKLNINHGFFSEKLDLDLVSTQTVRWF